MSEQQKTVIRHAKIVTEEETIQDGALVISEGTIEFIGTEEAFAAQQSYQKLPSVDYEGDWLLPGFIDVHVHGGFGHDFMEANDAALKRITQFHAQNGTTTMLATTVTAPKEAIDRVLAGVNSWQENEVKGARLAGVHLEGPFLSKVFPGAQNPEHMIPARIDWLEEWTSAYPGLIRMMTLAPEVEGNMDCIEWLRKNNIVAACGHTDAEYEEILEAKKRGLQHAVHTFNAMKPLHHRNPGTVGAVLTDDDISCEIIADGHHVHPACIDLLFRAKGRDRLILITDAMSAAGMEDGEYNLGDLKVRVKDGVARLKEGESLAGSTLTMIQAFRFFVETVGVSIEETSRMASGNPARLIGLDDEIGSISLGKKADLLRLDSKLQLKEVWRDGQLIDNKN